MANVPFSCSCGGIKGTLHNITPSNGNHLRCYCAACRSANLYTTGHDTGSNGVELYQTTPDKISFEQGLDKLSAFSFTPKKLLRYRASCCGVQMFCTLPTAKFALADVMTSVMESTDEIGPVASEAFIPQQDGTTKHSSTLRIYGGAIWRALIARMTGRWKQTPFFDVITGKPISEIYLPTDEERAKLPL